VASAPPSRDVVGIVRGDEGIDEVEVGVDPRVIALASAVGVRASRVHADQELGAVDRHERWPARVSLANSVLIVGCPQLLVVEASQRGVCLMT
jgi:hypothetical protein